MYDQYQPWVLSTYGDAAKTKTITARKYARIVALLRATAGDKDGPTGGPTPTPAPVNMTVGMLSQNPPSQAGLAGAAAAISSNAASLVTTEPTGSEAAKFRLWVKSKGFHFGPPAGHPDYGLPHTMDLLYLPTGTDKVMSILFEFLSFDSCLKFYSLICPCYDI